MKNILISKSEEGLTLIKYLRKIFNAPNALLQKLIRKKYFKINGKTASGDQVLKQNDALSIFLSDDTFEKFHIAKADKKNSHRDSNKYVDRIVYEDDNVIIFNKPVGMLSQGDKSHDESVNSVLNNYIGDNASSFKPSVVNRLDRNTEGLIIFAKTYIASKEISSMIKNNKLDKRYMATVNGVMKDDEGELIHLYKKDSKSNKAILRNYNGEVLDGYSLIKLKYKVIKRNAETTDIDINLITGKSHQIRAQFSYIGFPLVADKKYMDSKLYKSNIIKYDFRTQRLICYKIGFSKFENAELNSLSNRVFKI